MGHRTQGTIGSSSSLLSCSFFFVLVFLYIDPSGFIDLGCLHKKQAKPWDNGLIFLLSVIYTFILYWTLQHIHKGVIWWKDPEREERHFTAKGFLAFRLLPASAPSWVTGSRQSDHDPAKARPILCQREKVVFHLSCVHYCSCLASI